MSKNISIIIPSYNGKDLLKKNLPLVIQECFEYEDKTEILIIDDGSIDGTFEFISTQFPGVKIITKEKNEGFSKTINRGILEAKYPLIFLLNNDIEITSGILKKLATCFESKNIFAVQCKIISKIENKNIDYLNKFYCKYGFFIYRYEETKLDNREICEMDFLSSGATMFDKDKIMALGLFDEIFSPFYFEDLDLCFRAKMFGWKLLYNAKAKVFHLHYGSTVKAHYSKSKWNLIHKRNYFIFIFKNAQFMNVWPLCFILLPLYAFCKLLTGNFYFLVGFILSIPAIFKKRVLYNKTRKNILFLDTPLIPAGGGQISLFNIAKNLKSFKPFIIYSKRTEIENFLNKEGIPFYTQNLSKINFIFTWSKIIKIIKIINPQVIHCNSGTTFFTFVFALTAKILKIPFVWHVRVFGSGGIKEKIIAKLAVKIIVISDAVKERFNLFAKEKTIKLYNAIDTEKFKPISDTESLYKRLKLKKEKKIIGIFSRLDKWKGHKIFLEAAKLISSRSPEYQFLIVGDGPERQNIEKIIFDLDLSNEVLILGHRNDIVQLMNICDIIVNPSIEPEPFGRTIIEAMACGKVVIATNMGGPLEIIENGVDGFLVEANAKALADIIFQISNNKTEALKIGEKARRKIKDQFDIKIQIEKLEKIYQEIMVEQIKN